MTPRELAEALESERASVAHEIHDALLPLIFVAKATVDQADASSQEINQEASSYLARAMEVGRQIIAGALPPELETQDWSIAARRHIQSLHGDVSVTWKIDSAALQVSEPLALTCYRVTCEAVGNAVVHGAATEVLVESGADAGCLSSGDQR